MTWGVHGGMSTIVAGTRALLLQALHPGAMAGVHDWSRYKEDPLSRLAGTIRWIYTVSYGDTEAAISTSNWVLRLHERVTGTCLDAQGIQRDYSANDPDLLSWVHLAFTDSFLATAKLWGEEIPGGPYAYVAEWARAAERDGGTAPDAQPRPHPRAHPRGRTGLDWPRPARARVGAGAHPLNQETGRLLGAGRSLCYGGETRQTRPGAPSGRACGRHPLPGRRRAPRR